MKVVPIKGFPHDRRGQMLAGKVYEVDDAEGKRLMSLRLVRQASPDEYETKVVDQKPVAVPSPAVGETQPSSASQAAQASTQTIASESGGGALTYPVTLKLRANPPKPEETIAKLARSRGKKNRGE